MRRRLFYSHPAILCCADALFGFACCAAAEWSNIFSDDDFGSQSAARSGTSTDRTGIEMEDFEEAAFMDEATRTPSALRVGVPNFAASTMEAGSPSQPVQSPTHSQPQPQPQMMALSSAVDPDPDAPPPHHA